jgi:hypothetical protein
MRFVLVGCLLAFALIGCSRGNAAAAQDPPLRSANATPYEKARSGLYQINAALDSIEVALAGAKAMPTASLDERESLMEVQEYLDSAGAGLAEESAVPVDKAADPSILELRRNKLIEVANDSLHDLREARGIVDSLAEGNLTGPLEPIGVKIDVAMDDLRGALEGLGGREEIEG